MRSVTVRTADLKNIIINLNKRILKMFIRKFFVLF